MRKVNHLDQLRGQFESLVQQLNYTISTGEWEQSSTSKKRKTLARLEALLLKIRSLFSPRHFEKWMAGLAGLLLFNPSKSQNLTFVQVNPFNINPPTFHICPSFVDLDSDGDLDLYMAGNPWNGYFQENIGTATAPAFGPLQTNVFGLGQYFYGYTSADFADLDNDGDLDLLQVSYLGDFFYFENVGTAVAPNFAAPVLNPFSLVNPNGGGYSFDAVGEFVDIDNDGDLDIFVGSYDYYTYSYYFHLFLNTGTPAAPNFAAPTTGNFGNAQPIGAYAAMTFTDVDCDGDLDMLAGDDHSGNLYFYENVTGTLPPTFAPPVLLGFGFVPNANGVATPEFVDIDNDGVLELFVGTEYGDIRFHERACTPLPIAWGDFQASLNAAGGVDLNWETQSEQNSDYFLVERSVDLTAWESLQRLAAAGNSSGPLAYAAVDQRPHPGTSYYRLKQVDFNGEMAISPVVQVNDVPLSVGTIKVFPNPARDLVRVEGIAALGNAQIELYNALKQRYDLRIVARDAKGITLDISAVPDGVYLLRTGDRVQRFVKRGR